MPRLGDLDLDRHLRDPALKAGFVTPMFDLIAPRYDDFTRLFSFGMDRGWKRELVASAVAAAETATPGRPQIAVDLACGTGDIAFEMAAVAHTIRVTGIDASREMVALAIARRDSATTDGARRTEFRLGDLASTGIETGSADVVTAGYAFRNGPPLEQALAELARIMKPGGVVAVLDFYRPVNRLWRVLFTGYLRLAGNAVGWWWHREPVAYGYIASSIDAYVTSAEFTIALRRAGFEPQSMRSKLGGGVAVHIAKRTSGR